MNFYIVPKVDRHSNFCLKSPKCRLNEFSNYYSNRIIYCRLFSSKRLPFLTINVLVQLAVQVKDTMPTKYSSSKNNAEIQGKLDNENKFYIKEMEDGTAKTSWIIERKLKFEYRRNFGRTVKPDGSGLVEMKAREKEKQRRKTVASLSLALIWITSYLWYTTAKI